MSFFTFLTSRFGQDSSPQPTLNGHPLVLDLTAYTLDGARLGEAPPPTHALAEILQNDEICDDTNRGVEIGALQGLFEYVFVTLDRFDGTFRAFGDSQSLGTSTREAEVKAIFGEPYWIDRSDGETILFYEMERGKIECQFEFPTAETLGFITLTLDGVLSKEEQRKSYGVTVPWPPA